MNLVKEQLRWLNKNKYMLNIVTPHDKVARLVTEKDLAQVYNFADSIAIMNNTPIGVYQRFFAIAHPQVNETDPLRFFVLNHLSQEFEGFRSVVIINPVILDHTESTIDSEEGCASFSMLPTRIVQRWNKIEVEYSPLEFDENQKPVLGKRISMNLRGRKSKVFQHEIDHLNGKYIYEI